MKSRVYIFGLLFLFVLLTIPVDAVEVSQGTIFRTSGSSCDYHMADDFTFTNITVYSTALNINGGNITTYPSTGWVNVSIKGLKTTIVFTNNVTIANLTIGSGFANFSLTNGEVYDIRYLNSNVIFQEVSATGGEIVFTNIPSGLWQIYIAPPTMKEILIKKHVETTETSYALLGILGIVFLVVFILYILFTIQNGEEISFTAILMGFVMLMGFFILLYIMLPLFDAIISAID